MMNAQSKYINKEYHKVSASRLKNKIYNKNYMVFINMY